MCQDYFKRILDFTLKIFLDGSGLRRLKLDGHELFIGLNQDFWMEGITWKLPQDLQDSRLNYFLFIYEDSYQLNYGFHWDCLGTDNNLGEDVVISIKHKLQILHHYYSISP